MSDQQHRRTGRSIVVKLAAFVSCLLLAFSIVMNVIAFYVSQDLVRNQIHERLRVAAADRHKMILAYVAEQHERVALVASRTRLRQRIEAFQQGDISLDLMVQDTRPILDDARRGTATFREIWICDPNGIVITATDEKMLGEDHSRNPGFLQGKHRRYLSEPRRTPNGYVAVSSAPVVSNPGVLLGVVMVAQDVGSLVDILHDVDGLGSTGEILVATREGDRVRFLVPLGVEDVSTRSIGDVPAMTAAIGGNTSDSIVETTHEGVDVLAYYQPIEYQPADVRRWGLLAKMDVHEAYQPVTSLARILFLSEALLFLIGLVITYLLARRLTAPLRKLTAAANEIASGNLSAQAHVDSRDEIGTLADSFNQMSTQVRLSHQSLEGRVDQRTRELTAEIEQHKRTQQALKQAKQDAEEANLGKSQFLANMSHEIRTPMNGIVGMAELLSGTPLSAAQHEYTTMIQDSAESLMHLLNDILDFSKIEAGKLELENIAFDLVDCVGETAKSLSVRAAEKGLEMACRFEPSLPPVIIGDPGRLGQVLVNLIGNATKFTDDGEILIEVVEESRDSDQQEVCIRFSVSDTGCGIPPDKQQLIFGAFDQADISTTRQYGGTGLGLAITSQIASMMRGRVWVESEVGAGSTFHFLAWFGIGSATPHPRELTQAVADVPVLVVDDNETNCRIVSDMLANWGMCVTAVKSAAAAIQAVERSAALGTPFHLMLVDYMMPQSDGFELVQYLRENASGALPPVIMVSSAIGADHGQRCKELGIEQYMMKPVVQSDLWHAVIELLGTRDDRADDLTVPEDSKEINSLHILLAEDGRVNQRVAVGLLERRGHSVTVANNGREAYEQYQRERFDLVLMDLQMPEMDGFGATAAIRDYEQTTGRFTPIIALTAAAMSGDEEKCLRAGMNGYLSKPIKMDELIDTLRLTTPGSTEPQNDCGPNACRPHTDLPPQEI